MRRFTICWQRRHVSQEAVKEIKLWVMAVVNKGGEIYLGISEYSQHTSDADVMPHPHLLLSP